LYFVFHSSGIFWGSLVPEREPTWWKIQQVEKEEEEEDGCISALDFTRCLSSLAAGGGAMFGLQSPWFRQSLLLFSLSLRIISGRMDLTDPSLRKSR
jgi:hypothetical protein